MYLTILSTCWAYFFHWFLFICFFLFVYLWLCWVFAAVCRLSLVAASGATLRCGAQAFHCSGFSCC